MFYQYEMDNCSSLSARTLMYIGRGHLPIGVKVILRVWLKEIW